MSRPTVSSLLFVVTLLSTCIAVAEETPPASSGENTITIRVLEECTIEPEGSDSGTSIPSILRPDLLELLRAEEGQAVPLNSIIAMPKLTDDAEALLIIEFARRDLNEAFVEAVFLDRQLLIPVVHPYSHIGVEYLLTDERLILKIHPNVTLNLRDDFQPLRFGMPGAPEYQRLMFSSRDSQDIFKNDDAVGRVLLVSGNVIISTDSEFKESRLHNVHTELLHSSGSVFMGPVCLQTQPNASNTGVYSFPESFAPRVLRGR